MIGITRMPMPRPAASIDFGARRLAEDPVDELGATKLSDEEADDHRRDAGEHLDDRLDDLAHPSRRVLGRGRSAVPSPNGTATSIATAPITTLPTTIVRRSKRSRRGNQPVSVSSPKSQSISPQEVDRAAHEHEQDQQADRRSTRSRRPGRATRIRPLAACAALRRCQRRSWHASKVIGHAPMLDGRRPPWSATRRVSGRPRPGDVDSAISGRPRRRRRLRRGPPAGRRSRRRPPRPGPRATGTGRRSEATAGFSSAFGRVDVDVQAPRERVRAVGDRLRASGRRSPSPASISIAFMRSCSAA